MSASEPITPEPRRLTRIFSGTSGVILAVAVASLFVGACVLCGGALSLPFFIQSQRRADETVRRAQVEHTQNEIQHAIRTKAWQDAVERQKAAPAGDNPAEAVDPE